MVHNDPVTPAMVWDAYRALHRYVLWPFERPRIGHLPPTHTGTTAAAPALHPTSLTPTRLMPYAVCSPITKAAVERTAMAIHVARTLCPIPHIAAVEYAYYYLFVQLLRISFPYTPEFVDVSTGWKNLRWVPFTSLVGRADCKTPTDHWHRWYTDTWADQAPETRLAQLRMWYPMLLDAEDAQRATLQRHTALLHQLQTQHHCTAAVAVEQFDATGHPSGIIHATNAQWHPAIKASLWERWEPAANGGSRNLQDPTVCAFVLALVRQPLSRFVRFFLHEMLQAVPSPPANTLSIICDGFEDVIRHENSPDLSRRWKKYRAALLLSRQHAAQT